MLAEALFILAPYVLIAAAWLWFAYTKTSLMDEKRKSDINRALVVGQRSRCAISPPSRKDLVNDRSFPGTDLQDF